MPWFLVQKFVIYGIPKGRISRIVLKMLLSGTKTTFWKQILLQFSSGCGELWFSYVGYALLKSYPCLVGKQIIIPAFLIDQRVMGALFGNPSIFNHQDLIGLANGT